MQCRRQKNKAFAFLLSVCVINGEVFDLLRYLSAPLMLRSAQQPALDTPPDTGSSKDFKSRRSLTLTVVLQTTPTNGWTGSSPVSVRLKRVRVQEVQCTVQYRYGYRRYSVQYSTGSGTGGTVYSTVPIRVQRVQFTVQVRVQEVQRRVQYRYRCRMVRDWLYGRYICRPIVQEGI